MYAVVHNTRRGKQIKMVNRRKEKFAQAKMLSSRVEQEDYNKFEQLLESKNLSVQQFVNGVVRGFISGTIEHSGSVFCSK